MRKAGGKWKNDDEMEALVGEWWIADFEVSENESDEDKIANANEELKAHGSTIRVVGVREHKDGENLDWKLAD